MLEKKIADKIREIRKNRGITLVQLGEAIGLSKGLLSRIENNQVSPPIATLSKISQGLGVPISSFFDGAEEVEKTSYTVVKAGQRRQVVRHGTRIGFTYYSLTDMPSPRAIEPFMVKYPAREREPRVRFDHPGEEFLFVLKGDMELVYGREKIRLKPGDAIHFDPSVPHRGQSAGQEESECLVVVVDDTKRSSPD